MPDNNPNLIEPTKKCQTNFIRNYFHFRTLNSLTEVNDFILHQFIPEKNIRTGSNALTEQGQLVNLDCDGNRIDRYRHYKKYNYV